jgi:hypothetical protein
MTDGYTITHKGMLCSAPIPSAADIPTVRLLFVALEAVFSYMFWTVRDTGNKIGYADISPWSRDMVEYDPLCSHNPLAEIPEGDHNLSAEQLEARAAEMIARRKDYIRNYHEKVKKRDPVAWRAKMNEQRKKFVKNNPELAKKSHLRSMKKAVEEKRYYCSICDYAFPKNYFLQRHLAGPKHAAKAAPPSGEKKYYCSICDDSFTRNASLQEHFKSARHATKAALAGRGSS